MQLGDATQQNAYSKATHTLLTRTKFLGNWESFEHGPPIWLLTKAARMEHLTRRMMHLLEAVEAFLLDDVRGEQLAQRSAGVGLVRAAVRIHDLAHDEHVVAATDGVWHHPHRAATQTTDRSTTGTRAVIPEPNRARLGCEALAFVPCILSREHGHEMAPFAIIMGAALTQESDRCCCPRPDRWRSHRMTSRGSPAGHQTCLQRGQLWRCLH